MTGTYCTYPDLLWSPPNKIQELIDYKNSVLLFLGNISVNSPIIGFQIPDNKTYESFDTRTVKIDKRIGFQNMYSNHLNTGLVWYSNDIFVSGCQMVRYSNGGLKTGQKNPVYGPKCPVLKWSAKSCDLTIWIPDTHTVRYLGVRYSDGYCNYKSLLTWRVP